MLDRDRDRDQASDALRAFYLRSHRLLERRMAAEGVSMARSKVLVLIARDGPLRSIDLAAVFGHAPRTVTEAIDGLERDGLVRRDPDPEDRRAKRVTLTPAGEAAAKATEALRACFIGEVFGALTPADCAALVGLVDTLNARLGELGG